MASPKSKPMVMTGRNANKGPVFSRISYLKPSCITSVVNPSVASVIIRSRVQPLMVLGLNGIQILVAQMLRVQ